jgi:hypothetical protein
MFDDDRGQVLWAIMLFIIVGFGGCAYECAAYSECTKTHPSWYCAGR